MSLKLGEFLKIDTQKIAIDGTEEYKISGIQSYGKGVVIRRTVLGKELTMKQYQVIKENQLMWCKVDTKSGAFGVTKDVHVGTLASTNMALANIDTTKVLPDFLESIFRIKHFHESITKASSGSTNRKYLTPKQLFENIVIPKLSIEKQKLFLKKIASLENSELNREISTQQTYLTQLRQAILQEAIEGKLTADWRVKNPVQKGNPDHDAQALLETIKAEKQKLIADGKIKKEKPLAPINPDDVPFALPDGWVWVRLGNLTDLITSGSRDWAIYYKDEGRAKFVRMGNLSHDWFDLKNNKIQMVEPPKSEGTRTSLIENDLLISITGDVGWKALIPKDFGEGYINQHTALVRFTNLLRGKFFPIILCSPFSKKQFNAPQRGIKNSLRLSDISEHLIPLPPLAEQNAIVERVDRLLESVNALELQVQERKSYAQQLMQAVLKEAFAG
jgi:restriction endonuclease S subunit